MNYQTIKVLEKNDGAVTEIILSSPPGNILALAMMREITEQMKIDVANQHKKLVIFSAEGKHFSFGASVEEHTADKISEMLPFFHSFIGSIINCPLPTMAKISGMCLGGAFELALACTFICADESAKFGVPEIVLGVFPPPACILLPLRVGDALAAQMVLTGDQFKGSALSDCGLLSLLVEKGNLDEAVNDYFEKHFKSKSASSIRFAHKASRLVLSNIYQKHIVEAETMYIQELMQTNDANEGIAAFIGKREPQWKDS